MRRIILDKKFEVSLISMNARKKTCRVKVHYFGDDFAYIREYFIDYDFHYYSVYATSNDWKMLLKDGGFLSETYVKSIKMV